MKLLTRTSSIRRIAWNACRSCSPDSDSMCADSLARKRRSRVHRLAALLQELGDRRLGQPLHLDVGTQLAQGVGDRQVAAYVPQADRRAQVEDPRCGPA